MGPHPAVAAIRLAVRKVLRELLSDVPHDAAGAALPSTFASRGAAAPPTVPAQDHASGRALDTLPPAALPAPGAAPVGDVDPEHAKRRTPRPRPHPDAPLVLVACSGGADSMALAAATAFECAKLGLRAGGVTVDHGLQPGSAARAVEVAARLRALGMDPVDALGVHVGRHGGPESAAREARYAALDSAAERYGARAVLLGHTRDDQAETVLLGLARGSGTRSLSGMPAATGRYRRPFLDLDRAVTRRACAVLGLPVWDDPHNADPAYTRSRVRHEVLPVLEKHLGGGVVDALARTARLFRDDADALDMWASRAEAEARALAAAGSDSHQSGATAGDPDGPDGEAGLEPGGSVLDIGLLGALPAAVRRRVLRRAAIGAGSPPGDLFARHIEQVDELITRWHGQGPLHLPGGVEARRRCGRLFLGRQGRGAR